MQYHVVKTKRFLKSLKKIQQKPGFKHSKLTEVIKFLANDLQLPQQYHDHQLSGRLSCYRECHISPDILLMYYIEDDKIALVLANIGTHSKLFK